MDKTTKPFLTILKNVMFLLWVGTLSYSIVYYPWGSMEYFRMTSISFVPCVVWLRTRHDLALSPYVWDACVGWLKPRADLKKVK